MIYECFYCHSSNSDDRLQMDVEQILKVGVDAGNLWCANCGGLMCPEHLSPGELETWFAHLSRCPNAQFCVRDRAYRPECEKLVFYPGCLRFLWKELYETKLMLKHIAKFTKEQMYELYVKDASET